MTRPADILCFRFHSWQSPTDEEEIWAFVQRHGGFISIRQDCIDFFIHKQYQDLLLLAWGSELTRFPLLDYYE